MVYHQLRTALVNRKTFDQVITEEIFKSMLLESPLILAYSVSSLCNKKVEKT